MGVKGLKKKRLRKVKKFISNIVELEKFKSSNGEVNPKIKKSVQIDYGGGVSLLPHGCELCNNFKDKSMKRGPKGLPPIIRKSFNNRSGAGHCNKEKTNGKSKGTKEKIKEKHFLLKGDCVSRSGDTVRQDFVSLNVDNPHGKGVASPDLDSVCSEDVVHAPVIANAVIDDLITSHTSPCDAKELNDQFVLRDVIMRKHNLEKCTAPMLQYAPPYLAMHDANSGMENVETSLNYSTRTTLPHGAERPHEPKKSFKDSLLFGITNEKPKRFFEGMFKSSNINRESGNKLATLPSK
uniref:Uncharacterized protein n=1 Tax=Nelumbo nucifera TaxID=4432 RepID=A0A822Z791_NELNU|nr:TPA_asm: hypothetical protein HUJ06_008029 [Nelumbo nucifera]